MSRTTFRHKRKTILIISAVVAFLLALWITFSPNGIWKYSAIKKELKKIKAENKTLEAQNKALSEEIFKLKNDSDYLKEIARKNYGLIQKNEIIFEFNDGKK